MNAKKRTAMEPLMENALNADEQNGPLIGSI